MASGSNLPLWAAYRHHDRDGGQRVDDIFASTFMPMSMLSITGRTRTCLQLLGRAWILLSLACVGCKVVPPVDVFKCANGMACPPHQFCGTDLICHAHPPSPVLDAGGTMDSGAPATDASQSDAGDDAGRGGTSGNAGSNDTAGHASGSGGRSGQAGVVSPPSTFQVKSSSPGDATTLLTDVNASLQVVFSAAVATESITPSSFQVLRDGDPVAGTLSTTKNGASFRPTLPWALASRYQIKLSDQIHDIDDHALQPWLLDFGVREGAWSQEMRADGSGAVLAMASDGYALLVWSHSTNMYPAMLSSRFTPQSSWSATQQIKSGTDGAFLDRVVFNAKHQAAVSWSSISSDVVVSAFTQGPNWNADTYLHATAYDTQLILSANNELFAVLDSPIPSSGMPSSQGNDIYGDRFTLGTVSPAAISVGDGTGGNTKPVIALLAGEPRVLWQHTDSATSATRIMAGVQNSNAGVPLSAAGVNASSPTLTSNAVQSSAIATWEQADPTWTNIWSARIPAGGDWSAPVRVSDDKSSAKGASLRIDHQGRAVAVWAQSGGIFSASFAPGQAWTQPVMISDAAITSADPPQLVMEPGGNAVATWTQDGPSMGLNEVWAARYIGGEGWKSQSRIRISDAEAGTGDVLSAAIDDSGRAFVAWIEANQVWVARLE